MSTPGFLSQHFLIAMPALGDPNFRHAVIYVCQHDADGALGVVVNRPLTLTLGELFEHMEIGRDLDLSPTLAAEPVYAGGPVRQEQGFVLHSSERDWRGTLGDGGGSIAVTTSPDILKALAAGRGPRRSLMALGYAGWGAGQLEQEMLDNAWLSVLADPDVLFSVPAGRRWQAAATLLGVDLTRLSGDIGRA